MDAAGPSSKRVIMCRAWERRLEDVRIRDADVNKLVMNYLVTEGYAEAAEKFQIESGTEPDIDLATVFERRAVLRAVESCYLKETIEKLNRLDPMILVMNRQIDFRLQHQRMIEMIHAGEMEMALLHAINEILPGIENNIDFLKEFIRTTTLFPLLGPSQRLKLVSQVNAAILTSQNHEKARAGMGPLRWDTREYGADPTAIPIGIRTKASYPAEDADMHSKRTG